MSDELEPLNAETSLTARLDHGGVTLGAKSRFIAALDRLGGNWLLNLGAGHEERARRNQLRLEAMTSLARAAVEKLLTDVGQDRDLAADVLRGLIGDAGRDRANIDEVLTSAVSHLSLLEPQKPSSEPNNDEPRVLDPDWLNHFSSLASLASTSRMQDLWARILAGEVRQPQSFSLATLRIMSEMDQHTASTFQKVIMTRLPEGMMPKHAYLEGEFYLDRLFLEEIGLITGVSAAMRTKFSADSDGVIHVENGSMMLVFPSGFPVVDLPTMWLTRSGRELARILPREPDDVALRSIAEHFPHFRGSMQLMRLDAPNPNGRPAGTLIETI